MKSTTTIAYHFGKSPGFPSVPNLAAIETATATYTHKHILNQLTFHIK
jgi:hypothetical protein